MKVEPVTAVTSGIGVAGGRLETAARAAFVVAGVGIPVSTTLAQAGFLVALILTLLSGNYRDKLQVVRANPIALLTLALLGALALGMLYSSASWADALGTLSKYRELAFVALFVPLMADGGWRRNAIYAFVAAMAVTLVLSFLQLAGVMGQIGDDGRYVIFKSWITQNFFMAFMAFILAHEVRRTTVNWLRGAYVFIIVLAVYNVFFMVPGRTGYVVFVGLLLLYVYQVFGWRQLAYVVPVVVVLGMLAYYSSDTLRNRVDMVFSDIEQYERGRADTSIAMRLEFYKNSLRLMAERPVLGSGTGSFPKEYARLKQGQGILTVNPHNEYLLLGVQLGALGVLLFAALLAAQWRLAARLPSELIPIAHGMVLAFALGSLFNSFLLDFTEGHFYAYFSAVLYSALGARHAT